jgi:hypothetical protein
MLAKLEQGLQGSAGNDIAIVIECHAALVVERRSMPKSDPWIAVKIASGYRLQACYLGA